MTDSRSLFQPIVIASCAASAGIHGALVPAHLESAASEGVGFVAAAVLLLLSALMVQREGRSRARVGMAGLLLGGLMVAYALGNDGVDAIGATTQVVQATGVAAAIALWQSAGASVSSRGKEVSPS